MKQVKKVIKWYLKNVEKSYVSLPEGTFPYFYIN